MTFLLYGATGYTGQLIAEACAARGPRPILAGRKYRSFNQGFRWRTAPDEQGGPERRDPPHARAITPASADPLIPPITS